MAAERDNKREKEREREIKRERGRDSELLQKGETVEKKK